MDVFKSYTLLTSSYLSLQSLPLLLAPKLLITLCASEARSITDLETYLCRSLALTNLTLAGLTVLLTGTIPLQTSFAPTPAPTDAGETTTSSNPYAYPTLVVTTIHHALSAFYLYTQVVSVGGFGFISGLIFNTLLFCVGIWLVIFGSSEGKISKTTGADKRTGNFPFGNKESAKYQKKESKREEKEKDREGEKEKKRSSKSMSSRFR
ncbi:hypothetical protein MBLNU230_g1102t1 [Neophaeotheca triangularis]